MFGIRACARALLAVLLLHCATTTAESSSVFVLNGGNGTGSQLTFALNVAERSNDLYFHLEAPSSNTWVAIGTGNEMQNSLMFVLHTSSDGKNITMSPRLATGHSEPTYSSTIQLSLLDGSGISNGTYVANAVCRNCTSWQSGSLDLQSTTQPWIYAFGPGNSLRSNSQTATIQEHSQYGRFTMNMIQATGDGAVPTQVTANSGAAADGNPSSDGNWTAILHAVVTCLAFILLMPLGAVLLRFVQSVRWHWVNQVFASLAAIIGIFIGIYLSTTYNQSKTFNSAHQIIGILILVAVCLQLFLGWFHHRIYKSTQKTTYYALTHRVLGQVVIVAAMVNGGIGLSFASNSKYLLPYIIVIAVIAVIYFGLLVFNFHRTTRGKNYNALGSRNTGRGPSGQQNDSEINLNDIEFSRR